MHTQEELLLVAKKQKMDFMVQKHPSIERCFWVCTCSAIDGYLSTAWFTIDLNDGTCWYSDGRGALVKERNMVNRLFALGDALHESDWWEED